MLDMCPLATRQVSRQFEIWVGGARYLAVPMGPLPKLRVLEQHAEDSLVTVITTTHAQELEEDVWLEKKLASFHNEHDDVWTSNFLEGLLISTPDPSSCPPSLGLLAAIQRMTSWHAVIPTLGIPVRMRCYK